MDIRQHAWQHRDDLVQLDWKEICESTNYDHANILGEQNVSHKRTPAFYYFAVGVILTGLVALFIL